jgi:hypothetical protein
VHERGTPAATPPQPISTKKVEKTPSAIEASVDFYKVVATAPRAISFNQNEKGRNRSHRPEPDLRPPEDIQIHIGRVEVVAAPPPRPAVPKTRREMSSLEEYLRRRDGKTA